MGHLCRFVRFWFGFQAIHCIGVVPIGIALSIRSAAFQGRSVADFPGAIALWTAASVAIGIIPAIAWWKLKKGRPSARTWALTASAVGIIFSLPSAYITRFTPVTFGNLDFVAGVLGLIAFWRPQAMSTSDAAITSRSRLPGDGTSKLAETVAGLVAVVGLGGSYFLWSNWGNAQQMPGAGIFTKTALLLAAIQISIVGHEAGHAIAGWAVGMSLRRFQIGPFIWSIRSASWRFQFDLAHTQPAGAVGMVSSDFSDTRGAAWMILGGPIGSLVTACLGGIAAINMPETVRMPVWILFAMVSSISAVNFVVNMIPQHTSTGHYSDGAQFFQLIGNGPWATIHLALSMVGATLVSTTRPRDWDPELLHKASAAMTQGDRAITLRLYICMYYLDTGRIPETIASLEETENLFERTHVPKPGECYLEFVIYNALLKQDVTRAEYWWNKWQAVSDSDRDIEYWTALACIQWLKGEIDAAGEALAKARAIGGSLPQLGAYDFDRSRVQWVDDAVSSRSTTAVTKNLVDTRLAACHQPQADKITPAP